MNNTVTSNNPQESSVSIKDLWRACLKSWRIIAIVVAGCVVLSAAYLAFSAPRYEATMTIADAQADAFTNSNSSAGSALSQLAGLNNSTQERFAQFQEMLTSNEVAERLSKDPVIRHLLMQPHGVLFKHPTTVLDLKKILDGLLSQSKIDDQTVTISVDYKTPQGAVYILNAAYAAADGAMREQAKVSSSAKITYLQQAISKTTNAANIQSLINILSNENVQLMFAEARTPYAATILDQPLAPMRPINRTPKILAVAILLGLLIGAAIALWRRDAVEL